MRATATSAIALLAVVACTQQAAPTAVEQPAAAVFVAPALAHDDPVSTDGDKYTVVMENEEVRVLRFTDAPGNETKLHRHPSSLLLALGPFHRRFTLVDGTRKERAFATGDSVWFPAQTHSAENTGATPTIALVIELKRW